MYTYDRITDSYSRPTWGALWHSLSKRGEELRANGLTNLSDGLDHYNAWAWSAGAASSNVHDLVRFARAITAQDIAVTNDEVLANIQELKNTGGMTSWNGGSAGIAATIVMAPARAAVVIVLTNTNWRGKSAAAIGQELLESLPEGEVPPSIP